MLTKVFRYRLVPTHAQRTALGNVLSACCWVYNKVLETRREAWKERQEQISYYDTVNMLPAWKKERPQLKKANAQVLQEVCQRVERAYQHFFRRCKQGEEKKGYPRFKGHDWYKSFTYPQNGYKLHDNQIYLSKIGNVKIKLHHPIEGRIKRLTIKRDWLGNWYAYFVVKYEPVPLPMKETMTGIDVGCEKFATLSNGETITNPRFFRRDEKALTNAQSQRDKLPKGNTQRRKKNRVIHHIYNRIDNRRADFAHKLSRMLVNTFQILVFEKLNIKEMQGSNWRSLNKSIADAAWGQLISLTSYKAESAGRVFVQIDPKDTSQICSGCGEKVPKLLSERIHKCPHCGLEIDRDLNAARNILARGLTCLAQA